MRIQFFAYIASFWCQNIKTVCVLILLGSFFLFSDSLLPIIGHFLHILIEVVESILEHFLEATFGMTERQAQITLFYSAVIILAYIGYYLACQAYFAMCELIAVAKVQWRLFKKTPLFKTLLVFFAIGTTFYLFS
jgi:hypothetical protein